MRFKLLINSQTDTVGCETQASLDEQSCRSFDVATFLPHVTRVAESAERLGAVDEDVILLLNEGDRLQGGGVLAALSRLFADDKLLLTHSIALSEATGEVFGERPRSLVERVIRPSRTLAKLLPCLLTFRYGLLKKVRAQETLRSTGDPSPWHASLFLELLQAAGSQAVHIPRAMLVTRQEACRFKDRGAQFPKNAKL